MPILVVSLLVLIIVGHLSGSADVCIGALALAVVAWLVARVFARSLHLARPSVVVAVTVSAIATLGVERSLPGAAGREDWPPVLFGGFMALELLEHWRRCQIPMAAAVATGAVVMAVVGLPVAVVPDPGQWINSLFIGAGSLVFVTACLCDLSDRRRQTARSEYAVWLHLFASPLVVAPVLTRLDVYDIPTTATRVCAVAAVYTALAVVALALDRRVLLLSGILPLAFVFLDILHVQLRWAPAMAIAALTTGAVLLMVAARWHHARTAVLWLLPSSLTRRLAPLR